MLCIGSIVKFQMSQFWQNFCFWGGRENRGIAELFEIFTDEVKSKKMSKLLLFGILQYFLQL
jgi:hypothetical protein